MVERKDVEAALAARHELGPEYEPAVIDAFLAKVERELAHRKPQEPPRMDLRLPLGSFGLGIGATAVALSNAHGIGGIIVAIVAWGAIGIVNVVYAMFSIANRFIPRG
jgi:hypothetical protein